MSVDLVFAEINGAQIAYMDEGSGMPLVFVHAGIANMHMWEAQRTFTQTHRMIRYDMRGYGLSKPTSGSTAHHEDLLALLDVLSVDKAVLVGCSKGGGIALDAALAAPERVNGLVLAGSAAHGLELENEPDPPPHWDQLVEAYKAGDLALTNELEMQIWVDGYQQPVGRAPAALREQVRAMNAIVLENEKNGPEMETRVLEPKAGERLDEVNVPTLIIVGELDDPYMRMMGEKMAAHIPDAHLEMIPGTAHLPNMEKPEEFNALLSRFLAELA